MPTITKTIGTTARDYSTITLWEADLDNGAVYASGDTAVGECYNDSVFNESPTINGGGTVGLAAVKLSVASGQRHTGISGTGARIVRNAVELTINRAAMTVEWLELNANTSGNVGAVLNTNFSADTLTIQRMIIRGARNAFVASVCGINIGTSLLPASVHNNIIYDLDHTGNNSANTIGIQIGGEATHTCQNNTVHNIKRTNASATGNSRCYSFSDTSGFKGQNNIGTDPSKTGSGTAVCFNSAAFSSATLSHNLSSDTTASGTGSLTNKTSANQFVSTVGGSEDLHLKAGADAIDAGTDLVATPTGVNIDIDDYDRDAGGVPWDMGADEFISPTIDLTSTIAGTIAAGSATLTTYNKLSATSAGGVVCGTADLISTKKLDATVAASIAVEDAELTKTIKLYAVIGDVGKYNIFFTSPMLTNVRSFNSVIAAATDLAGFLFTHRHLSAGIAAAIVTSGANLDNGDETYLKGDYYDMPDILDLLIGETRTFLVDWDAVLTPPQSIDSIVSFAGMVQAVDLHPLNRKTFIQIAAGLEPGLFDTAVKAIVSQRNCPNVTKVIRLQSRIKKFPAAIPLERMHLEERKNFSINLDRDLRKEQKITNILSIKINRLGGGTILDSMISNSGKSISFKVDNPTVLEVYKIKAVLKIFDGVRLDTWTQYVDLQIG